MFLKKVNFKSIQFQKKIIVHNHNILFISFGFINFSSILNFEFFWNNLKCFIKNSDYYINIIILLYQIYFSDLSQKKYLTQLITEWVIIFYIYNYYWIHRRNRMVEMLFI